MPFANYGNKLSFIKTEENSTIMFDCSTFVELVFLLSFPFADQKKKKKNAPKNITKKTIKNKKKRKKETTPFIIIPSLLLHIYIYTYMPFSIIIIIIISLFASFFPVCFSASFIQFSFFFFLL